MIAAGAAMTALAVVQDKWITVRFDGDHGRHAFKRIDNKGVKLKRALSHEPCFEGKSWGHTPKGIWVDKGCRGEFEVKVHPK